MNNLIGDIGLVFLGASGSGALYSWRLSHTNQRLDRLAHAARNLLTNLRGYTDNPLIRLSGPDLRLQLEPDMHWLEAELKETA